MLEINIRKGLKRLFIPEKYAKEIRDDKGLKKFPKLRNTLIIGGYVTEFTGWTTLRTLIYGLYQHL